MELKEVLTTLGISEKIATVDEFKTAIETDWIRKDQIEATPEVFDKLAGSALGSTQRQYLRELKNMGIEPGEEIKGKKLAEILTITLPKIKESYETKITELEKKAGQNNDDKVKALENEKQTILKDFADLKTVNLNLSNEFSSFKDQVVTKEKTSKINNHFEQAYSKIPFKDGMTTIDHKGFKSILSDEYKFELGDNDTFTIRDTQGKIVISKTKAGQPATLDEILASEAEKNNLIKKVNAKTGFIATPGKTIEKTDAPPVLQGRVRNINLAARERAGK